MARPGRPASENYQSVCYSVSQSGSYSSEAGVVGPEDEDEAPIFSLSKSSMDVVMATGPPHKRDPTWTRMDLRRSSSTNTHSDQNSVTLQQLHPHMWQHINSHQLPAAVQRVDMHSPPALSERWIANMQRWSGCSTHSRSSTPDTVVWKGGTSRPSSIAQETPSSPLPKPDSPSSVRSPLISPLHTPTFPPEDLSTSSSSTLTPSIHQLEDFLACSPTRPPLPSPLQALTCSSSLQSSSPVLLQPTITEDEGFLENNSFTFTFPSPIPSSVSLAEGGASSDPGCLVGELIEEQQSPGDAELSEGEAVRSPVETLSCLTSTPPAPEAEKEASVCRLELPEQIGPAGRSWPTPLVSSLSDSLLGDGCRCNLNAREITTKTQVFREEGTMTSRREMVDAAVQTTSPVGSLWGLRRNNSNMGSHSFLGSPPGSRLNLKSSIGSNSNLVSPSSSMFQGSSKEEEEEEEEHGDGGPTWDVNSASLQDLERRRSCLKIKILQREERDEMGRRSSMKQVQWDEDGMTWDVHGASVDPEVLSSAIRKHLEHQNSPKLPRRSSKKKRAPMPPLISNVVKAMAPEIHTPVMVISSPCTGEGESTTGTPEADGGKREEVETEAGDKKEESAEAVRRISRAEGANVKGDDEVYGEEGVTQPKPPSHGSGHSRKRSVIRSLRRPAWCGGSRKPDN